MPRHRPRSSARPAPKPREQGPQRIAKLLARAGIASRREIERMIADGRIAVGGEKLTTPATLLDDLAGVTVDGRPVRPPAATRLYRFYKPQAAITAERDPRGRATIYDRLPKGLPRLMPVGRLDYMTEGLLLLTNDGELARRLELPATGWIRRYRVRVHGEVDQRQLDQLAKGIEVEGVRYGSVQATFDRKQGDNVWLTMSLTEGKNREIRKICGHFGWPVSRLIRVAYGPFQLGSHLNPGDIEEVPAKVLREQLGGAKVHKVSGQLKLKQAPRSESAPGERSSKIRPTKLRSR